MIPEKFKIQVFSENDTVTLFPIIPGENIIKKIFVLPTYVVSSANPINLGNKVIEVASYIGLLERGERVVEKVEAQAIPTVLGYSSWDKVKKSMNNISIWRGKPGIDHQILSFTPMHPVGRGPQYHVIDENHVRYANIENPADIGQAIIDGLSVF